MLREGEAGAQLGLDLGVGPAGHVVAQAAFDGVFKVDHPAHEVEIGLARGRVGQADVLVDQLAAVLEAQVPAQQRAGRAVVLQRAVLEHGAAVACIAQQGREEIAREFVEVDLALDRKSTRLNSSHSQISYAVFCLKKKKTRRKSSK